MCSSSSQTALYSLERLSRLNCRSFFSNSAFIRFDVSSVTLDCSSEGVPLETGVASFFDSKKSPSFYAMNNSQKACFQIPPAAQSHVR